MTTRRLGLLLAVWSAGFACVHVAWALGWRGGVPASAAPIGERPAFLAYDVLAAVLMYAAAGVALTIGRLGPAAVRVTQVAAVLALLRGVPALVLDAATRDVSAVGLVADTWFAVAGVAGLMLARAAAPGRSRAPRRPRPAGGAS
jgi:hypothetical protein